MLELFYKGGPLMYPLLLGSVLMVAIIIERACHFIRTGENRRVFDQVRGHIQNREFDRAEKITQREKSPVFILITEALSMRESSKDEIENSLSIRGDRILKRLSKNLHLLELIGKIAPMIGLLGTVLGMVEAFQKVSFMKSIINPSVLASGIWEALITTVAGLFVGIPALIGYHLYTNRMKAIAFSMKHYSEEIVAIMEKVHDRV